MKCKALNTKGEQCGAYAGKQSSYCFFHDPLRREKQDIARIKAGERTRAKHAGDSTLIPSQIQNAGGILLILDYTLAEAIALDNSIERGRLLISLSKAYAEVLITYFIEDRITVIENAVNDYLSRDSFVNKS